ncbi:MAG: low molecular weight phosphotyrosine protein phosphatase [Gammaproteobacteria bacterium]|nr:low molecular weight phosphotyrosine protein phosphatase [Gammaproteobacteria bacterium]
MGNTTGQFKILFVCMGNICRSPAAEGVFRSYIEARDNDQIMIDSAGTLGYHAGDLPDQRMRAAANRRGYNLDSRARQVNKQDITDFDLIVAMDHDNYFYLTGLAGEEAEHIKLLGHFLISDDVRIDEVTPVPDPYYGGDSGFEKVLDMIESACQPMLEYCLENQPDT